MTRQSTSLLGTALFALLRLTAPSASPRVSFSASNPFSSFFLCDSVVKSFFSFPRAKFRFRVKAFSNVATQSRMFQSQDPDRLHRPLELLIVLSSA